MAGMYMDPRMSPFMDEETADEQRRNRLQQIHQLWRAYPGRASIEFPKPAYQTGSNLYSTGATSMADYMQMLAEQREEAELRSGRPLQYHYDPGDKSSPDQRRNQLRQMDASRGLKAWSLG